MGFAKPSSTIYVKCWHELAASDGLKVEGPFYQSNRDAVVCTLWNGRKTAELAVSGLEMLQNDRAQMAIDLAVMRYNAARASMASPPAVESAAIEPSAPTVRPKEPASDDDALWRSIVAAARAV